jgi:hypothetical protein
MPNNHEDLSRVLRGDFVAQSPLSPPIGEGVVRVSDVVQEGVSDLSEVGGGVVGEDDPRRGEG